MDSGQRPANLPPADLEVCLFSRVHVAWRGRGLELRSHPAQALFALLALSRQPMTREELAAQIWPDGDIRATSRLRQALWHGRRALQEVGADADMVLDATDDVVALRPDVALALDVEAFEILLQRTPPEIEAAVALYQGDVSHTLRSDAVAAWRTRAADLYEDALAVLAVRRLRAGDAAGARDAARELLARDPLREEAHATLMELYGRHGSRAQVHRQYRRLRDLLETELHTEPLPATEAVYMDAVRWASARSRGAVTTLPWLARRRLVDR